MNHRCGPAGTTDSLVSRVGETTKDQQVAEAFHLDTVDKSIIDHLQADGRIPYSKLGPLVGLSPAAARQRVISLIDHGVVQIVAATDPTMLGFRVQAWLGIQVNGDLDAAGDAVAAIPEADYVVLTTGRFDIMAEVVCEDSDHLIAVMNKVRGLADVTSAEVFTYLRLVKQTYNWGTR